MKTAQEARQECRNIIEELNLLQRKLLAIRTFYKLKLVHNTEEKRAVRSMGCHKCDGIDWKF